MFPFVPKRVTLQALAKHLEASNLVSQYDEPGLPMFKKEMLRIKQEPVDPDHAKNSGSNEVKPAEMARYRSASGDLEERVAEELRKAGELDWDTLVKACRSHESFEDFEAFVREELQLGPEWVFGAQEAQGDIVAFEAWLRTNNLKSVGTLTIVPDPSPVATEDGTAAESKNSAERDMKAGDGQGKITAETALVEGVEENSKANETGEVTETAAPVAVSTEENSKANDETVQGKITAETALVEGVEENSKANETGEVTETAAPVAVSTEENSKANDETVQGKITAETALVEGVEEKPNANETGEVTETAAPVAVSTEENSKADETVQGKMAETALVESMEEKSSETGGVAAETVPVEVNVNMEEENSKADENVKGKITAVVETETVLKEGMESEEKSKADEPGEITAETPLAESKDKVVEPSGQGISSGTDAVAAAACLEV